MALPLTAILPEWLRGRTRNALAKAAKVRILRIAKATFSFAFRLNSVALQFELCGNGRRKANTFATSQILQFFTTCTIVTTALICTAHTV